MSEEWSTHIQRLKIGASQARTLDQAPEWIERNTTMNGKPFSFSGHRYQLDILRSKDQQIVVTKPSQIGLSEMVSRLIVARAAIIQPYNVIYCMPSMGASMQFFKTRVSNVINESEYLRQILDNNNDSVASKKLGYSLITSKGAMKGSQAISVNADCIVADEFSYCDPTIVKQFNSRLTHSSYKHMIYFSTPLMPGMGIDAEMAESRRHHRMCKCTHCNHWFWPSFLDHCRIPGHDVDWLSVNKTQLSKLPWQTTKISCPKCGGDPDLSHEHREWVCENPDSGYAASGWACSPFDVPSIIKPAYLAEKSVAYNRKIDWLQQNLGMAAEDKESTILRTELEDILVDSCDGSGGIVMGLDLGMICHAVIKMVLPDGLSITLHAEQIPVSNLVERYFELKAQWRVRLTVADFFPYSETILRLQNRDQNLFAAIYVTSKSTEPFSVKKVEDDKEKGQQEIRRVSVNRDVAFDMLMHAVRSKSMLKRRGTLDELWIKHLLSMKRVKVFGPNDEMMYVWQKTDGEDHFAHAEVYAMVASKMIFVSSGFGGGSLPMLSTFKLTQLPKLSR